MMLLYVFFLNVFQAYLMFKVAFTSKGNTSVAAGFVGAIALGSGFFMLSLGGGV